MECLHKQALQHLLRTQMELRIAARARAHAHEKGGAAKGGPCYVGAMADVDAVYAVRIERDGGDVLAWTGPGTGRFRPAGEQGALEFESGEGLLDVRPPSADVVGGSGEIQVRIASGDRRWRLPAGPARVTVWQVVRQAGGAWTATGLAWRGVVGASVWAGGAWTASVLPEARAAVHQARRDVWSNQAQLQRTRGRDSGLSRMGGGRPSGVFPRQAAAPAPVFMCSLAVTATSLDLGSVPRLAIITPSFENATGRVTGGYTDGTGLSFLSGGRAQFSPPTEGTFLKTYRATDASGAVAMCSVTFTVTDSRLQPRGCSNTLVRPARLTQGVSVQLGPTNPRTGDGAASNWRSSNLPSGISLSAAGLLRGTLNENRNSQISYDVTDSDGNTITVTCTYRFVRRTTTVRPPPPPAPALVCASAPSIATQSGTAATAVIPAATGGSGTKTYSITSNPGSTWFSFDASTRTITVSASAPAGGHSYTYQASDSSGSCTGAGTVAVTTAPPPLTCPSAVTISTELGSAASTVLPQASGGSGTKTSAVHGASPGSWFTYDPLSRTIQVSSSAPAGTHSATIRFTDSTGTCDVGVTVVVTRPATPLACGAAPAISVNAGASATATIPEASGGTAPYTYAKTSGPDWLTISGRTITVNAPVAAGTHAYSYTATDAAGATCTASASVAVTAVAGVLVCAMQNPNVDVLTGNRAFNQCTASGGTAPYTYTMASGSHGGVTVVESGRNAGRVTLRPQTSAGTINYGVVVRDADGSTCTARGTFTVTAEAPPPTLSVTPVPRATYGGLNRVIQHGGVDATITETGYTLTASWGRRSRTLTDGSMRFDQSGDVGVGTASIRVVVTATKTGRPTVSASVDVPRYHADTLGTAVNVARGQTVSSITDLGRVNPPGTLRLQGIRNESSTVAPAASWITFTSRVVIVFPSIKLELRVSASPPAGIPAGTFYLIYSATMWARSAQGQENSYPVSAIVPVNVT